MSIPNTRPRERRPIQPGEILREDFLPEYRLSVTALAEAAGVSRHSILASDQPRYDRGQYPDVDTAYSHPHRSAARPSELTRKHRKSNGGYVRFSLILLIAASSASASFLATSNADNSGARPALRAPGCGSTSPDDSAGFVEFFRTVASGPHEGYRTNSGLPAVSADSVYFAGTDIQCDSVRARYIQLRTTETGVPWTSSPVLMLKYGPAHWVADPKVLGETGFEWIVLDSTFTITKVWKTTGRG